MGLKNSVLNTSEHSTHIYNNTGSKIVVAVIFNPNGNENAGSGSTRVNLDPEDIKCVRTGIGEIMIRAYVGTIDNKRGHCVHTDETNRSFIIREQNGQLEIIRTRVGKMKTPE